MSKIHYTETGEGLPVILIHGFCETNELWNDFKVQLSPHFKILCPDLPGFGKSPLPEDKISITMVAELMLDWLKELKITECVVIGHSLGGYVALHMAELKPAIFSGLGLFHSSAFADSEEKKANRNRTIEFVKKNGVTTFAETTIPNLFYEGNREKLKPEIQKVVEMAKTASKETVLAYTATMRDREEKDDVLRYFTEKVLIIVGENDNSVPLAVSKEMENLAPQTNFHLLERTAHLGMYERKEETLKIVMNFCFDCI